MAQGKGFTPEQRTEIIQSLKPYLEMGFSRNKACAFIGLAPGTLSNWVGDDEALGMKLVGWENTNNALALANVFKALQKEAESEDSKVENSWKYLERKEESFKPKQDVTSNDKPLPTPILTLGNVHSNNSNEESSESN